MPCRPAISSHSLGRAWVHDIESKLSEAAKHGLDIEMFYEDLEYFAQTLSGESINENLLPAAEIIRNMCDERNISIVCLQPFMHYEGIRDRHHHRKRVQQMELWIEIAQRLGTKVIAVPSTCLSEEAVSGDMNLIIQDMIVIADLAASFGMTIAYEALAWGTYVDTWEQAWEVVQRVDRPNFGICLDTFNIAARVYADPTAETRKTRNAEARMTESLDRLAKTVDVKKIIYVQVVDAEYLQQPLTETHQYYNPDQRPRMSWSRNCRLFYGEEDLGAYLPIKAILKTILEDLGFEGWISAELFNSSLTDPNSSVPAQHAQRAARSWQRIVADFDITGQDNQQTTKHTPRRHSNNCPRAQL